MAPEVSGVDNFRRQHLVTKAILRRFATPSTGQLEVLDKEEMRVRPSGPNGVCWVDFFVRDNPEEIEQVWGRYETGLGPFYKALFAGELFSSRTAIQTARTMLALHAARSHTYLDIARKARAIVKASVQNGLLVDLPHELANQIQSRSPFWIPITPDLLLDEATKAVERNSGALDIGGQNFRERLELHFEKACEILERQGPCLEVISPSSPNVEFVISDDPVLIPSSDGKFRLGPLQGVTWQDASTFAMPFSPRYMIAASSENRLVEWPDPKVLVVNAHQVYRARRHVVARPGSGLAKWALAFEERRLERGDERAE